MAEAVSAGWFARLPASEIKRDELGAEMIGLLAILALHANRQGICWPSQRTLAKLAQKSEAWVSGKLSALADMGVIEKFYGRRPNGKVALMYRVPCLADADCAEAPQRDGAPEPLVQPAEIQPTDTEQSHLNRNNKTRTRPTRGREAPHGENLEETADEAGTPAKQVAAATVVPEDWAPDAQAVTDAMHLLQHAPDLDLTLHLTTFKAKCRAKGYRYSDHNAAWLAWLSEDVAAHRARQVSAVDRRSQGEARIAAWAAAARQPTHAPH